MGFAQAKKLSGDNSALESLTTYLKSRSDVRAQEHRQKIENIHQELADRGIPLLQEQSFRSFIEQCRAYITEEIETTWLTIQTELANHRPSVSLITVPLLESLLTSNVPTVEDILAYFQNLEERMGRPEVKTLVDRLDKQVSIERRSLLQLKQIAIEKFVDATKKEEEKRESAEPTYFDRRLRRIKNNRLLVWLYLIFSLLGLLGGFSVTARTVKKWVCGEVSMRECMEGLLPRRAETKK